MSIVYSPEFCLKCDIGFINSSHYGLAANISHVEISVRHHIGIY